jgi:hypothetical protein
MSPMVAYLVKDGHLIISASAIKRDRIQRLKRVAVRKGTDAETMCDACLNAQANLLLAGFARHDTLVY